MGRLPPRRPRSLRHLALSHTSPRTFLAYSYRWGGYRLDGLAASGTADSAEGVALEELSITSGPARLLARGNLLSARQEAELHVTDFPLDLLQVGGAGGGAESTLCGYRHQNMAFPVLT